VLEDQWLRTYFCEELCVLYLLLLLVDPVKSLRIHECAFLLQLMVICSEFGRLLLAEYDL
jgi:hypothetical protein